MPEKNALKARPFPYKEEQARPAAHPMEAERMAALRRCLILDTPPEAGFDRITALAARLFQVPAALIGLVDKHRVWLKSCGGPACAALPPEFSRADVPCPPVLLSPDVLVVEDARLDPRFRHMPPFAGPVGLRFYAGAPLQTPGGVMLGTLCLLDFQPRSFSEDQQESLRDLAAGVVSEIELGISRAADRESDLLHRQMFTDNPFPMWVFDAETLRFLDVNESAQSLYGYNRAEFLAMTVLEIRPPAQRPAVRRHFRALKAEAGKTGTRGTWQHQTKDGSRLWVEVSSHAVRYENRDARMACIQDVSERCRTEGALRRSEQKFAAHVQQMPLGAIELAPDMTVMRWNPAAERIFGYSAAEAVGRSVMDLIVPEQEHAHVQALRTGILTQSGGARSTNYNRTKSGEILLCDWYNTPLFDEAGHAIGGASLVRDITDEADVQERLRRSEAHKAAILETALDCIISIDGDGRVTEWNPAATETFGYTHTEAVGYKVAELIIPPRLRGAHFQGLARFLATGDGPILGQRVEVPALHRDGREFFVELTATAVQVEGSVVFTAYIRDTTERRAMEREREALLARTEALLAEALERADYDPLTGLLNHRAFHKRLKEEVKEEVSGSKAGPCGAVLLIDLDNFKFFNDAYGHPAGDEVLRRISRAFQSVCRPGDVLARFGGDEFALLLPAASVADAAARADALRRAVSAAGYQPPGYETSIPFTLSVGQACFPDDALTPAALLEAADARLRVAKSGGDGDSRALPVRRSLARSVGGFTMLDALVTAVDNKDRYTRRHSEDVMHYSLQIAQALGLDGEAQRSIEIAALLHDVGKIGVPDAILRKPGRLTEGDLEAIKLHPMMGSVIVGAVPGFEEVLDAVRHHHERWDGKGYPFGLAGEETPLSARLMAVADAYSAMTTDRPYRKGMAPDEARAILASGAGSQWDPACVRAFLNTRRSGTERPGGQHMSTDDITDSNDVNIDEADSDGMDSLPDGDRQLVTDSDALDEGGTNDSDLGADVAGDIGPKHD